MNYFRMYFVVTVATILLMTSGIAWAFGSIAVLYGISYKCQDS